jgi:hypothetical protein
VHRLRNSVNDDFVEAPEMEGARRAQTFPSETDEQRTSSGCIGEIVDGISKAVR